MKLKIAVIGCGTITQVRHAPEYAENPNVEIVGFCDPVVERAASLSSRYGGRAFSDYRELLELSELDAVSVCTANDTHASIAIAAFQAGKHVLCEKPMATSLEEAHRMIEAAEKAGKNLMIGHYQRLLQVHIRAKQMMADGELGKVLSFRTAFGHSGPETWSVDKGRHTWFFKKNSAFMGAMGDLGIHKADLIRYLLGDDIDEVCSMTTTADKRNEKGELIDVEDNAMCILKSSKGVLGILTASWTYYGKEDNSTVFYCEDGILQLCEHPEYPMVIHYKNGEKVYDESTGIQTNALQTKSGVIDLFVESIVEGKKPEISGEEGYEALSIILSCIESVHKKSFVKVKHYTA